MGKMVNDAGDTSKQTWVLVCVNAT